MKELHEKKTMDSGLREGSVFAKKFISGFSAALRTLKDEISNADKISARLKTDEPFLP